MKVARKYGLSTKSKRAFRCQTLVTAGGLGGCGLPVRAARACQLPHIRRGPAAPAAASVQAGADAVNLGDTELEIAELREDNVLDYIKHAPKERVEVPNTRIITDPQYLEYIGDGTPIVYGEDWPEAYNAINDTISDRNTVVIPQPHPKFTMQDLERIKKEGPKFEDLVLEHVEVTHSGGLIAGDRGEEYMRRLQLFFASDALEKQGEEGSNHLFENMMWPEFWKHDPWRYGIEDVERDPNEVYEQRVGEAEFIKTWDFNKDKYLQWRSKLNNWLEEHYSVPKFAQSYTYIPRTVLGDYLFEVEPNWLRLQQRPFMQFYQGLRQRNWTSPHYDPAVPLWRIQFFECEYGGITGWPGYRAVVTEADGTKWWVDMPEAGPEVFLQDHTSANTTSALWRTPRVGAAPLTPGDYGYHQAFQQIFQAHERRLPAGALQEFMKSDAISPTKWPYDCPADAHLDVSWHKTGAYMTNPVQQFLVEPSMPNFWALFRGASHWTPPTLIPFLSPIVGFVVELFVVIAVATFMIGVIKLGIVSQQKKGIVAPSDTQSFSEDPEAGLIFGRSKATARKEGVTGVGFGDVAGLDPILGELLEVVEFLKDPKSFSKLGARPPKGVLLEGDPGTGKTLLAKAIAGEALVPFFQMSGSEFVEGIIGVGAARIRDLFKRARAAAPCVVFVDELDALGIKRADSSGTANEEREQTLNQLLTEMDGFTPDVGVVFIGATNRADLLDPALLRPGRFDRKIRMPKPDTEARNQILKVHLRNKSVAPDVDLLQLSRDLPGLVGADLAAIVNEASIEALKGQRSHITAKDLYAGIDRLTQGPLRGNLPSNPLVLKIFATKEMGTALVATILRQRHGRVENVERVSIQPRGATLSRCMFMRNTDEDYMIITRGRLLDRIQVVLAGEIAIRVLLGEETNFGTAGLQRATRMAEKFVMWYGMSDLGITMFAFEPYRPEDIKGHTRKKKLVTVDDMDLYADFPTPDEWKWRYEGWDMSDVTVHRYGDEVRKVLKRSWEGAWNLLEEHKEALAAGVQLLIQRRELLGPEVREVFDKYPGKPVDRPYVHPMPIYTEGEGAQWPYGVEFLPDAYPTPYWVRKEQREREQNERERDGAGVGGEVGL